jgi:hypothetical protein
MKMKVFFLLIVMGRDVYENEVDFLFATVQIVLSVSLSLFSLSLFHSLSLSPKWKKYLVSLVERTEMTTWLFCMRIVMRSLKYVPSISKRVLKKTQRK